MIHYVQIIGEEEEAGTFTWLVVENILEFNHQVFVCVLHPGFQSKSSGYPQKDFR